MAIFNTLSFLNQSELENFLKIPQNIYKFKENKGKYIKVPTNWSNLTIKDTQSIDFADTTLCIIPLWLNPGLFVIDCDNLHTFNYVFSLISAQKITTLCTKSEFGGHFFFKIAQKNTKNDVGFFPNLPKMTPPDKFNGQFKSNAEQAKLSKSIKIEFFSSQDKRLIFDGANNNYYRIYKNAPIATLSHKLLNALQTLVETNPEDEISNSISGSIEKYAFCPNLDRYETIQRWLKDKSIDIFEFLSLYNNRYSVRINENAKIYTQDDFPLTENRNNFMASIFGWSTSCGYFKDWQEVCDFITLIYEDLIGDHNSFTLKELNNTILNKSKSNKIHYYDETTEFLKEASIEKKRINIEKLITQPVIITQITTGSKGGNYALIEISSDMSSCEISLVPTIKALMKIIKNSSFLTNAYLKYENDEWIIDEDKIYILQITHKLDKPILYEDPKDSIRTLYFNKAPFEFNHKILKIKNLEILNSDKDQIIKDFENTFFYKICKNNLFPIPEVFHKYLGDFGSWLRNPRDLHTMCILKDPVGGVGKTFVLSNYLKYLAFGKKSRDEKDIDCIYSRTPGEGCFKTSLSHLINMQENFNDPLSSNYLIFVDEDAGGVGTKSAGQINQIFNPLLRSNEIEIHPKGKPRYAKINRMFITRFTNTFDKVLSDSDSNTRYYAIDCVKTYDLKNPEHLKQLGVSSIYSEDDLIEIIEKEEEIILKYLIHIAPFREDYIGFSSLPKHIPDSEKNELEGEDIKEILSSGGEGYNPSEVAKAAINEFITPEREINMSNVEKYLNCGDMFMSELASILNDYYAYDTEFYIQRDTCKHKNTRLRISAIITLFVKTSGISLNIYEKKKLRNYLMKLFNFNNAAEWINKSYLKIIKGENNGDNA